MLRQFLLRYHTILTPAQFTIHTSPPTTTMETLPRLTQTDYPTLIYSLADSLVSHFLSLENEGDLMIPEGQSSLNWREYSKLNNLDYSSLKMLKGFSAMMVENLLAPSSKRLMSWGMTSNGKCLTARITESPRTGNASSLSDILEEQPDQKYFLSDTITKRLMSYRDNIQTPLPPVITEDK